MRKQVLTSRQFEILNILWDAGRPLLISEIAERHSININTVQYGIKALIKMGYVEVAEIVHSKNVLARTYQTIITKEEYLLTISKELGNQKDSGIGLIALVKKENNWNILNEIEKVIEEKRKREERECHRLDLYFFVYY